jgi:transcriptional regulator with XRE-family HTH domain
MPRQKSTHVDDPKEVGSRLRAAREAAGLSQRQLAFPGCSPAYISRIESGDRIPSLQLLRDLGRRLGVSADFLATGSDPLEREKAELEAEVALRLGELDLAESLYTTMLETSPEAAGSAVARAGLGQVAFARGDLRSAIAQLENALEHTEGGLEDLPDVADSLGRAYTLVGELETAIAILEGALAEAERRDDRLERTRFQLLLGEALVADGNLDRAEEVLDGALALGTGSADPGVRADLYWTQSRLSAERNDSEASARYAKRALEILRLAEEADRADRAHRLLARMSMRTPRTIT